VHRDAGGEKGIRTLIISVSYGRFVAAATENATDAADDYTRCTLALRPAKLRTNFLEHLMPYRSRVVVRRLERFELVLATVDGLSGEKPGGNFRVMRRVMMSPFLNRVN